MARVTGFVWLIIAVAAFAATYNTVVTLTRSRVADEDYEDDDEQLSNSAFPGATSSSSATSGVVVRPKEFIKKIPKKKRYFHTAMTCNDSPYVKWQSRIMYYYYKKYKDHPDSEMGGFTRVLHSGYPDNLMDEIPTMVVDPLPTGMDMVSGTCS